MLSCGEDISTSRARIQVFFADYERKKARRKRPTVDRWGEAFFILTVPFLAKPAPF